MFINVDFIRNRFPYMRNECIYELLCGTKESVFCLLVTRVCIYTDVKLL